MDPWSAQPVEVQAKIVTDLVGTQHHLLDKRQEQSKRQIRLLKCLLAWAGSSLPLFLFPRVRALTLHPMDKREDPQDFPEVLQATAETCWPPENECSLWLLPLVEVAA